MLPWLFLLNPGFFEVPYNLSRSPAPLLPPVLTLYAMTDRILTPLPTDTTFTFEQFLDWKPDYQAYELLDGTPIPMQPTGQHELLTAFIAAELTLESRRQGYPYCLPKQAIVRALGRKSGYIPDVLVVDATALPTEPLWESRSTLTHGRSIPLVVEVVSHNWHMDYGHKFHDYEQLEIQEYWIVDYLGLGGRRYIGSPKQPTLSIYQLVEGEYQGSLLRGNDPIVSQVFPNLQLTAAQIFQS